MHGKVVSGSWDHTIKIFDAQTWQLERTLTGHTHWVTALAVVNGGRHLVSGSADATLRVWDARNAFQEERVCRGHRGVVYAVSVGPPDAEAAPGEPETLASGAEDGLVLVWSTTSWRLLRRLEGHEGTVRAVVAFRSPPAGLELLVSGAADGKIRVWNALHSFACERVVDAHTDWVEALAVMPASRLASASRDETVRLWSVPDFVPLQTLRGHSHWAYCLAIRPSDGVLVSGSCDMTINVWR